MGGAARSVCSNFREWTGTMRVAAGCQTPAEAPPSNAKDVLKTYGAAAALVLLALLAVALGLRFCVRRVVDARRSKTTRPEVRGIAPTTIVRGGGAQGGLPLPRASREPLIRPTRETDDWE